MKGSKTIPFGGVNAFMNLLGIAMGNWQGWFVFSICCAFTLGISQTSEGFLPKGFPLKLPLLEPLYARFPGYF